MASHEGGVGEGNAEQFRMLAELGAKTRYRDLMREREQLLELFPSLDGENGNAIHDHIQAGIKLIQPVVDEMERRTHGIGGKPMDTTPIERSPSGRRKRPPLTASAKRAIGRRMKQYWAERRRQGLTGKP